MTPENAAVAEGALIGHCIDERYRLEAVIGVGGLGSVYRATHTKLQRPVAVKLLHESFGESQIQRGRFAREAKALAALQHPNIVAVLDYGVSDAQPYLVMELLEGETLSQRLHEGPLALTSALRIVQQLLEALSFMHRARLVHRDVKPSNVFLLRDPEGNDRVKVLDFGLAKFTAAPMVTSDPTLTRDGAILGTPAYMSPEQATGEIVDARSDVYAVGVILFRMLSGRLPFEGDAIQQVRSHLIAPVPPINRPDPDAEIDAVLQAFIGRAMEKRREDRYADAGQMLKALVESFPQHVHPSLPEHEPVLPDPFAVDALNADWLLSVTDMSSETPTLPRDPRAPAEFTRTRESVQRVGRAFRALVVTSVKLFAGISVLLVVGAGAIYVLLLRNEADRAELSALQRRVQDRLMERSMRRGAQESDLDARGASQPSAAKAAADAPANEQAGRDGTALVAAPPASNPPGAAPAQEAVASATPLTESAKQAMDAVPLPKELETSVSAIEGNGAPAKLALPAISTRLAAALERAGNQGATVEALEPPAPHVAPQPSAASAANAGSQLGVGARVATGASATANATGSGSVPEPSVGARTTGAAIGANGPGAASGLGAGNAPGAANEIGAVAVSGPGAASSPGADNASGAANGLGAVAVNGHAAHGAASGLGAGNAPGAANGPGVANPTGVASKESSRAAREPGLAAAVGSGTEAPVTSSGAGGPTPSEANGVKAGGPKDSSSGAASGGSTGVGARASSSSDVPAVDPWREPIPPKLRAARRTALANGAGSEAMILALRAYNREQRDDPRGHLLLGQLYLNRFWRADALSQFSIALTLDPSARGAPEVLPGLLALVAQGEQAQQANRLIISRFGAEAVPAIDNAIARQRDSKAQARLRWLRSRLVQ